VSVATEPNPTSRTAPSPPKVAGGALSPRLVWVFAVACGLVVANLYYAQPLLNTIATAFQSSSGTVGVVATLTQAGYALGLAFIVPLGDLLDRRRLVVVVLCGTALALLLAAAASSLAMLAAASLLIGLTSVVAQVLIPFAASLADEAERGRVVGRVMSGLLVGILLARTVSGVIAQAASGVLGHAGWRAVYVIAAVLMVALIAVLWRAMPRPPRQEAQSYGQLLRSMGPLVREELVLRRRAVYGALAFAAFSVFWTSAAFLLARPPYRLGAGAIGLFGLVGVAGALCASLAGRLADRGLQRYATPAFLLITLIAYGLMALGGTRLVALIVGVVLLDLGVQGTQITNQSEIYRLRPEANSRITTIYMTTYFIGGAVGSATSAVAFGAAGWTGVCILGAAYASLTVLAWLTEGIGTGGRHKARARDASVGAG